LGGGETIRLFDLEIGVNIVAKNVAKQLRSLEDQGRDTDRALEGVGDGAERGQKKATGAFGKIARGLRTLRSDAAKGADFTVTADLDDAGLKSGIADLKRTTASADDTVHVGVDFDKNRLSEASAGFGELSGKIREFRTVSGAVAGIPALIAAIGGAVPLVTALAGAVGQLAIGLGQGLAGAAAIGGTAVAGAAAGLKIYAAALSSTITASREAYEATHEHRMELIEQRRQQILSTNASLAFNKQLDRSSIAWTRVQAAIGRAAFPTFTRELRAWTGLMPQLQKPLMDLVTGVTRIGGALSESLRTGQNFARLRDVLAFVARQGNLAAGAISNLVRTGLLIANQLIPYADRLSLAVAGLVSDFQRFAESERGTRALVGVFALLNTRMTQVFKIAGNLGAALYGVFRGLNFGGQVSALMRALVGVTAEFARVMEKGNGARLAISRFMAASRPALIAVWNLTKTVVREFGLLAGNLVKAGQQGGKIGTLATVVNSLSAAVRPLRILLQDTFIGLGPVLAKLIPEVAKLAGTFLGTTGPLQTFLSTVTRVLSLFNRLPTPVKNAVASLVALKAIMSGLGLSGLVGGIGRTVSSLATLRAASASAAASQRALALAQGQAAGASAASGAAAAASAGRVGFFARAGGVAATAARGLGIALRFMLGPWGLLITAVSVGAVLIYKNWDKVKAAGAALVNWYQKNFPKTSATISRVFNTAKRLVSGFISGGLKLLQRIAASVVAWFVDHWPEINRVIVTALRGAGRAISAMTLPLRLLIKGAAAVVSWFVRHWPEISKTAQNIASGVARTLTNMKNGAVSWVKSLVGAVVNFWKNRIWQPIANFVVEKKEGILSTISNLRSGLEGAWESIRSAASSAWEAIGKSIVDPISDAYDSVVDFIDRILGAVNKVLDLVGLPTIGGGSGGGSGGPTSPQSAGGTGPAMRGAKGGMWHPSGRTEGLIPMARGGIIAQHAIGGVADGRVPRAVYGEVGKAESYAVHGRRDNIPFAQAFAESVDMTLVPRRPESRHEGGGGRAGLNLMAEGGILDGWRRAGTRFFAHGATMYQWAPGLREKYWEPVANAVPGTTFNNYEGHPDGFSEREPYSADYWGPGGRGDPIGVPKGDAVLSAGLRIIGNALSYWMWNGRASAGVLSRAIQADPHGDHVHFTAMPGLDLNNGAGGGGGGFIAARFGDLWDRIVQPVVDTFLGPLKDSANVMANFAGAAAQKVPDGVKKWAMEKLGGTAAGGENLAQWAKSGLEYGGAFPATNANVQKMVTLGQKESGGVEDAVNPTSVGGEHASGAWQMLPSTFNAYKANPGDDIMRGEHNAAASANYQKDRYGGLITFSPYDRGGLMKKEHGGILHPNEIVMPLDRPHVAQTFAALSINDLISEVAELRAEVRGGITVNRYGEEAKQVIVVGAREGGLGAMESESGRRIVTKQLSKTGRLAGISGGR
jgi:hypothetical protein